MINNKGFNLLEGLLVSKRQLGTSKYKTAKKIDFCTYHIGKNSKVVFKTCSKPGVNTVSHETFAIIMKNNVAVNNFEFKGNKNDFLAIMALYNRATEDIQKPLMRKPFSVFKVKGVRKQRRNRTNFVKFVENEIKKMQDQDETFTFDFSEHVRDYADIAYSELDSKHIFNLCMKEIEEIKQTENQNNELEETKSL